MTEQPEEQERHPVNHSLHDERRNFPRVAAAYLVYIDAAEGRASTGGTLAKTLDISISGVAVEVARPLPPGNRFIVVLSLHNEVVSLPATANRCVLVSEDLWEVAFQIEIYSKPYFQLL